MNQRELDVKVEDEFNNQAGHGIHELANKEGE